MRYFRLLSFVYVFFAVAACTTDGSNAGNHATQQPADSVPAIINDTTPAKKGIDLSAYDRKYNDAARFVAGMQGEQGSVLAGKESDPAWLAHRDSFDSFFGKVKADRIPELTDFVQSEMTAVNSNFNTLLYPYSGPDFAHANIFFPNAKQIIMFGLEPVGTVPDLTKMSTSDYKTFFSHVAKALTPIFVASSYYFTNDMGEDYSGSAIELNGITPVFYAFFARFDYIVLSSRRVTVNDLGEIVDSLPGKKDMDIAKDTYASGVEFLYYKEGDDFVRKLYYFSHDVSDNNLKSTPGFAKFIDKQEITASYYKAASYISRWFSVVRGLSLSKSSYIFQDDSGIPIKYFDKSAWDVQLYGSYIRTLKVFADAYQPDLKQLYDTEQVKPLPFGIGYNNNFGHPNLMIATKKQ